MSFRALFFARTMDQESLTAAGGVTSGSRSGNTGIVCELLDCKSVPAYKDGILQYRLSSSGCAHRDDLKMSSKPQRYGEIEIGLHPIEGETYDVDLRIADPDVATETAPRHARAQIRLRELQLLFTDARRYGERLTDQLFADPEIRTCYSTARQAFDDKRMMIRLRLLIDPGAPELNTLRWELLLDPITKKPIATSERILFSRFMPGQDRQAIAIVASRESGTSQTRPRVREPGNRLALCSPLTDAAEVVPADEWN